MGIVASDLRQALAGQVFVEGQDGYEESLNSYFSAQAARTKPHLIVRPHDADEVADALSLLVRVNKQAGAGSLKFAIRSGGYATQAEGSNVTDGVALDLRDLNSIEVSEDSTRVTVGTGASWADVYRKLEPLKLMVAGGRHARIGVGGLTLGGGLSHLSSKFGLVCDNVLEYEVVLASGKIVHVTENDAEYADLFHALRGASNNFGIVARFVFRCFPLEKLWAGSLTYPLETKDEQIQCFYDFAADPKFDPNVSLTQRFRMSEERGSDIAISVVYSRDTDDIVPKVVKPFTEIEPMHNKTFRQISLAETIDEHELFNEKRLYQFVGATTLYLDLSLLHRTYDLWDSSCDAVQKYDGIIWSVSLHIISVAAILHSPFLQDAIPTLLEHPDRPIIMVQLAATWKKAEDSSTIEEKAKQLIEDIESVAVEKDLQTGYLYLNYAHPGQKVFGGRERREKLRTVSKKHDPDGVFQKCATGGFKIFEGN